MVRIKLPGDVAAWVLTDPTLIGQVLAGGPFSKHLRSHLPSASGLPAGREVSADGAAERRRLAGVVERALDVGLFEGMAGHREVALHRVCDRLALLSSAEIVDLREQFAVTSAIQAVRLLLGATGEHAEVLGECVGALLNPAGGCTQTIADDTPRLDRLVEAVRALVADKRADPTDGDLTTALLATHYAGELTEHAVTAALVAVIVATAPMTTHIITAALDDLLTRPGRRRAALYGDLSWSELIEDALRRRPLPIQLLARVTTEAVTLGDAALAAGELILLWPDRDADAPAYSVKPGATDPDQHPQAPGDWDPFRRMGKSLARRYAREVIPTFARRFPDMAPASADRGGAHVAAAARLGRGEPSTLTATLTDGPRRGFRLAWWGHPVAEVIGVASDLYRWSDDITCRQCAPVIDRTELRTTMVYRVHDPAIPWYVTVEIHRCQDGHARMIIRPTATVIRLARDHDAGPDPEDPQTRLFWVAVDAADGSHRTLVRARHIDDHLHCAGCDRCYGRATAEILDNDIPDWLHPLTIDWCDHCVTTTLSVYTEHGPGVTDAHLPSPPTGRADGDSIALPRLTDRLAAHADLEPDSASYRAKLAADLIECAETGNVSADLAVLFEAFDHDLRDYSRTRGHAPGQTGTGDSPVLDVPERP
ncbi:cytochrome P450 [Nocardia takedensis]|uniref:cytochrome P450 n=1 Tax=Nocardia takedensis TaxID=259390 RepID=UPI0002DF6AB9|nr:cytochrome P450 [Nocardia takedensis]